VKLALADRDLSYVNADGTHMIGAGTYQLSVGGGQPGTSAPAATATFSIKGDRELPR
jgi:beta-glucosidase